MGRLKWKLYGGILLTISFALGGSLQAQSDVLAINAGGSASGSFAADADYSSGTLTATVTSAIDTSSVSNPAPQAVYQSQRYAQPGVNLTYTLPGLTAGVSYNVILHFAETYFNYAGARQFDVVINGTQVLTNFDIYAAAGGINKAVIKTFPAIANSSGQIVINFNNDAANFAAINGIEIQPVSAGDVLAINAGGSASGSFAADADYSSGTLTATVTSAIDTSSVSNPAPQAVYQSQRYAQPGVNLTYTLPGLTAGASYNVILHFAETYFTYAGARQFDVVINGTQVLTNFDIYAAAGGINKAVIKTFPAIANSSGQIVINFNNDAANFAAINGIEIQNGSGGGGSNLPDMIVTSVGMSPASPTASQAITFNAVVKNQGVAATPAGTITGVGFLVDGTEVTWEGSYNSSIAPGQSVTLTADGGPSGSAWTATSGSHALEAYVNDAGRYSESNSTNNTLTQSFTVGTGGGGGPSAIYIDLGSATSVVDGGNTYLSDSAAGVVLGSGAQTYTSGNSSWSPNFSDTALGSILNTQIYTNPGSGSFTVPVSPGNYQVSVGTYENYAPNARTFDLTLNSQTVASNIGSQAYQNWTEYGPYNVTVDSSGILTVGLVRISGDPSISYMKIVPGGSGSGGATPVQQPSGASMGPLQVAPGGYYFETPSGQPVYLAGSHNWTLQQDWSNPGPGPLDFNGFLSYMEQNEHINFIRDWVQEHSKLPDNTYNETFTVSPMPWARSSQCCANDGGNKFDLSQYDDSGYFARLISRIQTAEAQGVYVSVMLFTGNWDSNPGYGIWNYNPWNGSNNINGINPSNGWVLEDGSYAQSNSNLTSLQNAYVCHVVQEVGNFPNVLYEVANEAGQNSEELGGSEADLQSDLQWQESIVSQVHSCESQYGYAYHPVGITSLSDCGGTSACANEKNDTNTWLLNSNADWVALGGPQYQSSNYQATGKKVVMMDTDHIFGGGGDQYWVWGQFMQGNNILYMDNLSGTGIMGAEEAYGQDSLMAQGRLGINETRQAASLLSWNGVVPSAGLSSTGFCLANAGSGQFIVYAPSGGSFTVNISAAAGNALNVTWINVGNGAFTYGSSIVPGSGSTSYLFNSPFSGAAALVLSPAQ